MVTVPHGSSPFVFPVRPDYWETRGASPAGRKEGCKLSRLTWGPEPSSGGAVVMAFRVQPRCARLFRGRGGKLAFDLPQGFQPTCRLPLYFGSKVVPLLNGASGVRRHATRCPD